MKTKDISQFLAREGPSEKDRMINRYSKAIDYTGDISGKVILDAAAGDGFGVNYLSSKGAFVVGLDIDKKAHESYLANTDRKGIYMIKDITRTGFPKGTFDMVFSVETIEHLPTPSVYSFLNETDRVLKKDGQFVVMMPQRRLPIDKYPSGNHFREYTLEEFLPMANKKFNLSLFVDKSKIDDRSDLYIFNKK